MRGFGVGTPVILVFSIHNLMAWITERKISVTVPAGGVSKNFYETLGFFSQDELPVETDWDDEK